MTNEIGVRKRISEAYQIDYAGMEAVVESCENCDHRVDNYCTNLDTKHFIDGGMVDKPLLKPSEWRCPLWQLKASG